MYHDVVPDGGTGTGREGPGPAHYRVTWETFVEHLDRIGELLGTPPVIFDDVPAADWVSPACSLTFDDGAAGALDVGEELRRRGWCAYFFVTTGLIGSAGFVDADAIRALDAMGHVIGSHSVTHPLRMAALPPQDLLYEWQASVETLSALLGREIRTGSVPGGSYGRHVAAAAARAGIDTLFTSEPVRTARHVSDCLVIGRYAIRENTSAWDAARAAAGSRSPWLRQYAGWNLRRPAKALAGDHYERIRRAVLAARSTPPAPQ